MPRGSRLDMEGALHHVIARELEARDFLLSDTDHEDLVKRMTKIAAKTRTSIQAWSLMSKRPILLKDLRWEEE